MSKEKVKYCRYLKSAEDSLKKALLLDNYTNRSFTVTTKISKSAKYSLRNPIKIINGANYESDASELNMESVEPVLTDISPPISSDKEQSPSEADLVWIDPEILEKADRLESAEITELRGLENHLFLIRGSNRQISVFVDRKKLEKVYDVYYFL